MAKKVKKEKEKDVLIDSHVSSNQAKKAVVALLKHQTKIAKQKEETELLPGREENIWLVLSVKKANSGKKLKLHRMCVVSLSLRRMCTDSTCVQSIGTSNNRPSHEPSMPHHEGSSERVQRPARVT